MDGVQCAHGEEPIFGGVHLVARFEQHFSVELADVRLVLHHEDALRQARLALKRRSG